MWILVAVIFAFAGSVLAVRHLDGIYKLTRDYPGPSQFNAPLYECAVYGITTADASNVFCLIGANETGLYLTYPPGMKSTWYWTYWKRWYPSLLKSPIFAPWSALAYSRQPFLTKECIRFDIPSNRSYFYVPLATAEKIFSDARRPLPGWSG